MHLPIWLMVGIMSMFSIGRFFEESRSGAGLERSITLAPIRQSGNLLFTVLSWLLSLAVSCCYFAAPGVKKSEFPPPKLAWSLFFRCMYQQYQPARGTTREAIARAPA
jgi:hypothetical protein